MPNCIFLAPKKFYLRRNFRLFKVVKLFAAYLNSVYLVRDVGLQLLFRAVWCNLGHTFLHQPNQAIVTSSTISKILWRAMPTANTCYIILLN